MVLAGARPERAGVSRRARRSGPRHYRGRCPRQPRDLLFGRGASGYLGLDAGRKRASKTSSESAAALGKPCRAKVGHPRSAPSHFVTHISEARRCSAARRGSHREPRRRAARRWQASAVEATYARRKASRRWSCGASTWLPWWPAASRVTRHAQREAKEPNKGFKQSVHAQRSAGVTRDGCSRIQESSCGASVAAWPHAPRPT